MAAARSLRCGGGSRLHRCRGALSLRSARQMSSPNGCSATSSRRRCSTWRPATCRPAIAALPRCRIASRTCSRPCLTARDLRARDRREALSSGRGHSRPQRSARGRRLQEVGQLRCGNARARTASRSCSSRSTIATFRAGSSTTSISPNRSSRELALPNVWLQFDIYHRQIIHGDVVMALRRLMPITRHVQIASVPSRNEPDGEELNFPFLFDELDRLGYDGYVAGEYRPRDDDARRARLVRAVQGEAVEHRFAPRNDGVARTLHLCSSSSQEQGAPA